MKKDRKIGVWYSEAIVCFTIILKVVGDTVDVIICSIVIAFEARTGDFCRLLGSWQDYRTENKR